MGASLSFWHGLAKLLSVHAHFRMEVISPLVTTAFDIWRKEANPLWCVSFVKGICLSFFSTSADAVWTVCPDHQEKDGNSAYW